ncbi:hypothetical protein Tco_0295631 [Tanacetum coccineum]
MQPPGVVMIPGQQQFGVPGQQPPMGMYGPPANGYAPHQVNGPPGAMNPPGGGWGDGGGYEIEGWVWVGDDGGGKLVMTGVGGR